MTTHTFICDSHHNKSKIFPPKFEAGLWGKIIREEKTFPARAGAALLLPPRSERQAVEMESRKSDFAPQ